MEKQIDVRFVNDFVGKLVNLGWFATPCGKLFFFWRGGGENGDVALGVL